MKFSLDVIFFYTILRLKLFNFYIFKLNLRDKRRNLKKKNMTKVNLKTNLNNMVSELL